jgi:hypothetical protein
MLHSISRIIVSYTLVLTESKNEVEKDVGDNIFLQDLQFDYKVYLFYYPSDMPNEDLENRLRVLGNQAGKNLLVNIGKLNDPSYNKIVRTFKIKDLPAIIVTASADLASVIAESKESTAYVRIDNERMLSTVESTVKCVQRVFNLFISEQITDALNQLSHDTHSVIISRIKGIVTSALNEVGAYFSERDISISLFEGKLELKRNLGARN